jgi:hypothetical protein
MRFSSIEQLKSNFSPQSRFAPAQEISQRTGRHGGTPWAPASLGEVKLYQPQDARLTGGTRSLMRRLSGLNMGMNLVRRAKPIVTQAVMPKVRLTNANVA